MSPDPRPGFDEYEQPPSDKPGVIRLSDVEPELVDWLWPGRIPFGKLTILEGDPKVGKSTMAVDIAARVSTGTEFPDGTYVDAPGVVILMSAEDGLSDTIRPRLDAAGAEPKNVIAWESMPVFNDDAMAVSVRSPSIPRDIAALEELISEHGAVLVIVDVLSAYLGSDVDGHRDQDIRRALMPLAKMAERTHAAVLVLRHLNKSSGGNALYRGGGSIGIAGAARSILLAAVDPLDETGKKRVLASTGANLAAPAPSLEYHLESSEIEGGCARVAWDGESDHTSSTLLANQVGDEERSAVDEAYEFLRDTLSDNEAPKAGGVPAKEVEKAARDAGISVRTLHRAKSRLKVKSEKGSTGPWCWVLPTEGRQEEGRQDEGGRTLQVGNVGNVPVEQGFSGVEGSQDGQGCQPEVLAPFPVPEVIPVLWDAPSCSTCGAPPPRPGSFGLVACDHQLAAITQ